MTDEEIEAAAAADPDNPPLTDEQLARAVFSRRVRLLRDRLDLSQADFAGRSRIPVASLRDWEQGRRLPDAATRAVPDRDRAGAGSGAACPGGGRGCLTAARRARFTAPANSTVGTDFRPAADWFGVPFLLPLLPREVIRFPPEHFMRSDSNLLIVNGIGWDRLGGKRMSAQRRQ